MLIFGARITQIRIDGKEFIFGKHRHSDFKTPNAKSYKDFMKSRNGEALTAFATSSAKRGTIIKTALRLV